MTAGKRLFDIALALILTVVLLPVGLGIAVMLLLSEGRPVFYISERMKTRTQAFDLWKFRTMCVVARDGGVSGGEKSGRISRLGRLLRRTRLDELPQLWNVLHGDISLVGPRPPLREYVERFPEIYAQVLRNRPGITGLATVVFHRHEERLLRDCRAAAETNAVYVRRCVPRKARLDMIYQHRRTIWLDLWLIGRTAARAFGLGPGGRIVHGGAIP